MLNVNEYLGKHVSRWKLRRKKGTPVVLIHTRGVSVDRVLDLPIVLYLTGRTALST